MGSDASDALGRAIDFLLARQGADGLWRDFRTPAGEATTWPTAYVATALRAAADPRVSAALPAAGDEVDGGLTRAAHALSQAQKDTGGWGYGADVPDDADSTAWALLFLAGHPGRVQAACERAATRLAEHQHRDGGVRTYAEAGPIRSYTGLPRWMPFRGWCRPTVEVSAVAAAAFAVVGAGARAAAAWAFVRARQAQDGHWDAYWWDSPLVATRHAAALAAERGDVRARRLAECWTLGQKGDGLCGTPGLPGPSAFASALALAVLAGAGAQGTRTFEQSAAALAGLQLPDGGWPAHALLRIPVPADRSTSAPDRWRPVRFQPGVTVRDHNRVFTTATCVAALASGSRV